MTASVGSMRIEVLTKENYDTWKMQVEALLTKNDLWEYVSGENVLPALVPGDAATVSAGVAAQNAWKRNDKKAKSDLILSIHSSELQQVRGCETSREVWLKLESIYASKGPARKATLLKQLMLQRLQEGGDVREHMARFFDAVDKLMAMGVEVNGDLLSIMLLYSLPAGYDNFRVAIESRDDLPTPEALKIKILEESEVRRQADVIQAASALATNRNVRRKPRKRVPKVNNNETESEDSTKLRCYTCGTPGHKSPDCPDKKNKPRDKSKQVANTVDDSYVVCSIAVPEACRAVSSIGASSSRSWILDSGCTSHLCGDRDSFDSLYLPAQGKLKLANQSSTDVQGCGAVKMSVTGDTSPRLIRFDNTLYVPDLRTNLISVAKITDKGHKVIFQDDSAIVVDRQGQVKFTAERKGNLYYIRKDEECAVATTGTKFSELKRWHERLGHLNVRDLVNILNKIVGPDAVVGDHKELLDCETCHKGKMTTLPFPKGMHPCTELLEIVHSDIVGPMRVNSKGGARFFITFIDDSSRWCEVYFLSQKGNAIQAFKMYKAHVETQLGKTIKSFQTDNGREYCNREFDTLLADYGIERRLTVPRTPQQNGVAERMNRTLLDMARCLLLQSGLPSTFWAEAVATACHIRNRCPTSTLEGITPYEKWTGSLPSLNHMRVFGSTVYVLDKDSSKDKFDPRSNKGIFVGYPRESKGYRIWLLDSKKIVVARDVKFLESNPHSSENLDEIDFLEEPKQVRVTRLTSEDTPSTEVEFMALPTTPTRIQEPNTPHAEEVAGDMRNAPHGRGRPRLLRTGSRGRPRKLYQEAPCRTGEEDSEIPTEIIDDELEDDVFAGVAEISICEALNSNEKDEWRRAIQSEVKSLVKNDTLKIITTKKGQNIIGSRLVLTNKYNPDGSIQGRKARIVAKGYSQKYGVDYHQTFAPVARLETIRLLMAIAAQYKLKVHQIDVVTAYLNAPLNEEVIMEIPEQLEAALENVALDETEDSKIKHKTREMLNSLRAGGNACKLNKALYGLRQSGRQWYSKLDEKLRSLNLVSTKGDACLYVAHRGENMLLLVIYVDDILIASQNSEWISEIKQGLKEDFDIKDLGLAKSCLGLEIYQNKDAIMLTQTGYIINIIRRFGMEGCNPIATPAEVRASQPQEITESNEEWVPYRELIGALLYLAVATRPDIANAVSRLAQFTIAPERSHWIAAKRILRYLTGTVQMGLIYTSTDQPLLGYSDADWGGDLIDRRLYSGYVFLLSGAAISWKSQKQRSVALSSTEAEYVSLSEAIKEAIHLRSLLVEIGLNELTKLMICIDNQGAQQLANDVVSRTRLKHVDVRYHFIQEIIKSGIIKLKHVPTERMVADVLTKSLPRISHERCTKDMGLEMIKEFVLSEERTH